MANHSLRLIIVLTCALPISAFATPPEIILNWCGERSQADSDPANTNANYRTGVVIGYLSAVLDALREDNPTCIYEIDEAMFCSAFKTYIIKHGAPGGSSFEYAKDAIVDTYGCKRRDALSNKQAD
jgi:hypothetical protein